MRQDIINTPADSGLGDKLKIAFDKVNEMFIELYQQDDDFLDELNIIQNIIEQLNDGSLLNHTHLISQIIGLQTSLDSKLNITTFNTQISSINASIQQINTTIDNIIDILQNKIDEAPVDNTQYVRINATWSAITLSTGATGATGPQGIQGPTGPQGATGSSLLQENVFDAYLGTRLVPVNTAVNGFGITKSVNGQIGLLVKNTDTSGNAALAAVTVGGDGTFYENGFSLIHYGANYYLPYLRNTGGLYSTNNFNFINVNNTDVDFRTSTASLGSDTSKFRIAASGSLHIGVTPSTDNTISSLLGRKSTGEIVSYAISSIVGTTGPTGPQGATGSQGIQGATGATGPAPDTSIFVPYTGATQDVDLGDWGITAKYYDRPYDDIGGFFITGQQYLAFRFDSYGEADGVPDCSLNANGEEGITLMANLNDLSRFTQIGCSNQWGYVYVRGTATESNTNFYPDRTTFTQQTELPKVLFNSTTETSEEKSLTWNDADGTLDLGLKGGNVTLQIGQESVIRVVNKTATNITLLESNYQAVRVTGAQGNRLKVDLAQATTDNLSAETIGLVTETIANNQEGFITTSGLVRNINTTGSLQGETWNDGDILYLSPTVAGQITKVKPVAPQHLVVIGYVVYAHINQGSIFVKVNNGYELDELHNVRISGTPSNNQTLSYNSSLGVWENGDYFDAKPVIYQKHTNIPTFGSAAINNVEGVSILASGPVARNWADTDIVTRTQRMGLAVSTTGNLAQLRQTLVYLSRNGGFDLTTGFNMAENASDTAIRFFIGLTTNNIFTNVEPNTLLNIIGICRLSSSDNLHLINNDNTGTATTLDLGSNFPANTISTDKYLINIKTVSTGVYLKLDRIGTAFSYETTLTSDIPSVSTGLNFGAYIVDTTGANATTGFDWYGSYIMTNN